MNPILMLIFLKSMLYYFFIYPENFFSTFYVSIFILIFFTEYLVNRVYCIIKTFRPF